MTATDLLAAAFSAGMSPHGEIHRKWISVYHRLAADSGIAHISSLASDSRLDLLLRTLEAECLERLKQPETNMVDLSADILLSLSECWVLRTYEVIRATWQRVGRPNEGKIYTLCHRLGLARMPIAKGEIQKSHRAIEPILLAREGDGAAKQYSDDGSYVVPRAICSTTGAAKWIVVDINPNRQVEINRRDLSDEFLILYD